MSIIVDALERVEAERRLESAKHPDDKFAVDYDSPDPLADFEESSTLKKWVTAILLIVLAVNGYLFLKNSQNEQMPFVNENLPPQEVKTINEVVIPEPTESVIEETIAEETPIEQTVATDPVDTLPITPVEPEIIEEPIPYSSPKWVLEGIRLLRNDKLDDAVKVWNKGFLALNPEEPIISIMINRIASNTADALQKLHNKNIDAFTVQGIFKRKAAYFTLVLKSDLSTEAMLNQIEHAADVKPMETTPRLVQKRVVQWRNFIAKQTPKIKKPVKVVRKKITLPKLSRTKRLQLAQEAVIDGNYKQAIQKLRPILFNHKANWEVFFWIGSAKLGLGQFNEADDYFNKALELNSDMPQVWTQRAIIAQERNNHIAALKFLHKAQKLAPTAPEIVLNIAYSNDALGDRNGAVFAYREYLSLTQDNTSYTQQRQAVSSRLSELGF